MGENGDGEDGDGPTFVATAKVRRAGGKDKGKNPSQQPGIDLKKFNEAASKKAREEEEKAQQLKLKMEAMWKELSCSDLDDDDIAGKLVHADQQQETMYGKAGAEFIIAHRHGKLEGKRLKDFLPPLPLPPLPPHVDTTNTAAEQQQHLTREHEKDYDDIAARTLLSTHARDSDVWKACERFLQRFEEDKGRRLFDLLPHGTELPNIVARKEHVGGGGLLQVTRTPAINANNVPQPPRHSSRRRAASNLAPREVEAVEHDNL